MHVYQFLCKHGEASKFMGRTSVRDSGCRNLVIGSNGMAPGEHPGRHLYCLVPPGGLPGRAGLMFLVSVLCRPPGGHPGKSSVG